MTGLARAVSWRLGVLMATLVVAPVRAQGLELETELLAANIDRPVAVTHAGDGSGRLFLVEQTGRILIHDGSGVLPAPFLDLSSEISCCGEKGLLGLAFHPSYETNGAFFVAYTEAALNGAAPPQNDLIVARFQVSAHADVADPASEVILLDVFQPYGNHNGADLAFGLDGFLYIGLGDGGSGGDPGNRAQNLDTLLGKMLRIDVDGTDPGRLYAVPSSNPFAGDVPAGCSDSCPAGPCGSTCDEIWSLGLRNPWRFSFDRELGDLYLGDVGQGLWEEVDYQNASSLGGENYGWNVLEGTHCYPPDPMEACTPPPGYVAPILEYNQDTTPGCAVTGGFVYRGSAFPQLRGVYLYADFCQGTIWGTVPRCDGEWESRLLLDTPFLISSFGEDELGELVVTDLANVTGEVHRIGLSAASGGPVLEVLPAPIDFGSPPAAALEVTLASVGLGAEALQIRDLSLASGTDFTLDVDGGSAPCETSAPCLAPGESCTVALNFAGAGSAWFLDTLLLPGNSGVQRADVGACTAAASRTVTEVEVSGGTEAFDACETLTLGPDFSVTDTGIAVVRAGDAVILANGTSIAGEMEIYAALP